MFKRFTKPIQTMRDEGADLVPDYGKQTTEVMGIELIFLDKNR